MLKKENRLPASCFRKIYSKGRVQKSQHFVFRKLENNKSISRFGVVISTKVIKKAVTRNLIKRRILEIIKKYYDNIRVGQDLVFVVKKEAEFNELDQEIKTLLDV